MFLDWFEWSRTSYHPRHCHQGLLCITDYVEFYSIISRRLLKLKGNTSVLLSRKCFMQLKTFKNIRRRNA